MAYSITEDCVACGACASDVLLEQSKKEHRTQLMLILALTVERVLLHVLLPPFRKDNSYGNTPLKSRNRVHLFRLFLSCLSHAPLNNDFFQFI